MFDSTKPATGGSLVAADIRENFRALKEDGIVLAGDLVSTLKDPTANTAGLRTLGTGAQQAMPGNATPTPADNSVTEAKLASKAVSQAKLKTSQGSVSTTSPALENLTLPGGEYGFYPQVNGNVTAHIAAFPVTYAYTTNIALNVSVAGWTAYAQQRYVTSSGEVFWIFILRDKITKEVKSMYQAPDHPCFGNGGKPLLVPHPFPDYDETKHEIIVINPSHEEVEAMKKLGERGEDEPDKDLLEVIMKEYEIDEDSKPAWPTKAVTVGLPKDNETKKMGEGVQPIKKAIPRPPYIKTKSLRRKA